jgi:signal peptidase II
MRNKYYLFTLLILALDHLSKWIVWLKLDRNNSIELVPGYLRLSLVCNSGVAFGFFAGGTSVWKPYWLAAMAVLALVVLFLYGRRMPPNRQLLQWALALTMGGILGNFVDRLFRGYVIDFIEFHVHESFYFPNFNVADSAITIGIALLLLDTVCNPTLEEAAEPTADGRPSS